MVTIKDKFVTFAYFKTFYTEERNQMPIKRKKNKQNKKIKKKSCISYALTFSP